MIKVIQFIHGLNMGGAETLVKDYALGFDKNRIDLTVLCYEHRDSPYEKMLEDSGIKVVYVCDHMPLYGKRNLFARFLNRISLYILIRRYIHQIAPDVIHMHLLLSTYLKFARPSKSTAIFYTQHFQVERWKKFYPKDIKAAKWLMNHYNMKMIALNASMKQEIDKMFHTDKTLILNNGIDMERFRKALPKEKIREKIGVPFDAFVVGHVGRFSEIKNHAFLVDVFAEIARKRRNAFLLMIGKGDTMEEVQRKIKQLGIEDKAMILSDRTDVPDLMRAMDILVFPSFSEGMPVTLVEAQISEVKCVVSDSVPKAIEISNLIRYKSLQESAEDWADEVLAWQEETVCYYDVDRWDMRKIIGGLEDLYFDAIQK